MSSIDGQIIASRIPNPSAIGEGVVLAEVPHQQLNTALAAGTVDTILMKSGYVPIDDYNVVVKKDLGAYITLDNVKDLLMDWTTDCGYYNPLTPQDTVPNILLKSNYGLSNKKAAGASDLSEGKGEVAIDPFDGTLYVWGNKGTKVVPVNAGTVNGYEVNREVPAVGTSGTWLTRAEIVNLINASFIYNSSQNALTIVKCV